MDRVDIFSESQDPASLQAHLARYLFVGRLLNKDDHVLDFGSGLGYGSVVMSKFCSSLDAFEPNISPDLISQRFPNTRNVSFANQYNKQHRYDVIVALEVIEHLDLQQGKELLVELISLGKPGAMWCISTPRALPHHLKTRNRQLHHLHEYGYTEFKHLLNGLFSRVLFFSQNDATISTQNPEMAWNFLAICFQPKNITKPS